MMGEELDMKLKPCPFCGEDANTWQTWIPWGERYAWIVGCDGTWGGMCPGYAWKLAPVFMTSEQAIRVWNRRAQDEAQVDG